MVGDIPCQHVQINLGTYHGQRAAALQAGAGFVVDKGHMDVQNDAAFVVQAHQVQMRRQVFHHITLHAAADDVYVRHAFNLQIEQRGQETARLQTLEQRVIFDVDRLRRDAVTVNDTGNISLTTCLTSGPLACPRPHLGDKISDLTSHRSSPYIYPPTFKGAWRDRGAITAIRCKGKPQKR